MQTRVTTESVHEKVESLNKEVHQNSVNVLKNKFLQKAKEMHKYLAGGNLYKFESGTLYSEIDKDR
jgi:hypothetical protein